MNQGNLPGKLGTDPAHAAVDTLKVPYRHPQPAGIVHALVLKGRWHYLEHDWVAETGSYAFEPPGATHTFVVPDDSEEMVTYFIVNGSLVYVDRDGRATGYDDVFTRLAICADHYERVGLGREHVRKFVR